MTCAYRPAGRTGAPGSGLRGKTSAAHEMEDQAPAEIEAQLETLGWCCGRRAQGSKINKLPGRHYRTAIGRRLHTTIAIESAPPPLEARCADALLLAEGAYAQATVGKLRQKLAPDIRS